jgi:hypothetical protein
VLLSQLHSTHDKAEWFTPMNTAVAGLTAEQAKWVPQNAQGKRDPNANHSVGMLAYHLVFWNENALARLHGEKPTGPNNNDETFNDFDAAHWDDIVQRLDRDEELEEVEDAGGESRRGRAHHHTAHITRTHGQILYVRKLQDPEPAMAW